MICLIWDCFSDVFKAIMLLCFPCWCIWHLLRFLWKCVMRPFFFRILRSDLFFRYTVTQHGDTCTAVYPPPSRKTVQDIQTYCQSYLNQIITILGFFKTLILKINGYFKKVLFGDRNEVDKRNGANGVELRRGTNGVEQRSGANGVEQRRGAKRVKRRSGANRVKRRSGANGVEQRSGANGVEQGANGVELRSGGNGVEQRSGANGVEQRSGVNAVEQRSGANGVEQRSGANGVEQRSGANGVEQRSGANGVEQRSGANGVEQRSGANGVEQRSGVNGVEQRSGSNGVEQRRGANRVEQRTFQYSLTQPFRATQDTQTYCQGYPGKEDNLFICDNWLFYSNKEHGRNSMSIDQVHQNWFGNYSQLETCHDYIQWLFPIRETSMYNHRAQELQLHEAKMIREDPAARQRVLKSYHMMLDFWGMRLEDERTGVIVRGDNWEERFRHLNRSSHNYLRITRMLKCLGELDFEHLKFPFLSFILYEVFLEKTLINASESCLHYWIHLLRDEEENGKIREIALDYIMGG